MSRGRPPTPAPLPTSRGPEAPIDEPDLEALLATASPTWTWSAGWPWPRPDRQRRPPHAPSATCSCGEEPGGLVLSPGVPEAWLGQGWEVHDLPTAEGRLGYAIRWHGDRPALLWDLEPPGERPPVRLRVPSLDPAWSIDRAARRGPARARRCCPSAPRSVGA